MKKIAISGISKVAACKKITLKATITPSNATNKKVTWKSSNTSYATVDQKGVVTTKSNAAGKSVTITATAQDGSGIKGTYNLSIYGISKITLSGISKKIAAGKKITLTTVISPSDVSNKKIKWTSSNTKVATVSSKGVVTIKKKTGGKTVTITATAQDGSKKKATYKISVMKGEVTKVAVSGNKPVNAGKSLKLKAKVTASKGANKALKWTSSNTKYAKVNSAGKVTTLKAGKGKSVKITAMATDGSGKKKSVTVKIK
ncbi:MAG: Ig-like domain-containing protein [Lachnospiraceae bacterium]|nr:Ig-like domain-containing protein [Lachnospiraceae bacterium]